MESSLSVDDVAEIIGNARLANDIFASISEALGEAKVHLVPGDSPGKVFSHSLAAAIRDIEVHPRGKLFQRLIRLGVPAPENVNPQATAGRELTSDDQWGACLEFIYSHMVNRFKGELAELLGIKPAIDLFRAVQDRGIVPTAAHLYLGDVIQQRRGRRRRPEGIVWGGYSKGADGLIVEHGVLHRREPKVASVLGVVEIKSFNRGDRSILRQIDRHIERLQGGIRLSGRDLGTDYPQGARSQDILRILVKPSKWKLSRRWERRGDLLVFPDQPDGPSARYDVTEVDPAIWAITLAWSEEALEQAAYEMTFWYMGQVGATIYTPHSPSP